MTIDPSIDQNLKNTLMTIEPSGYFGAASNKRDHRRYLVMFSYLTKTARIPPSSTGGVQVAG